MLTERRLWVGATTMTIGILLLLIVQPRLPRHNWPASMVYATYGNCTTALEAR